MINYQQMSDFQIYSYTIYTESFKKKSQRKRITKKVKEALLYPTLSALVVSYSQSPPLSN